jgi:membrane-associated phospholipid phosphatase
VEKKMEKLLKRIYESKKTALSLKIISHASSLISVVVYAVLVIYSYLSAPMEAVRMLIAAGVPFVLVSIVRKLVNAPRPYEIYEFYESHPKEKAGESFPSRHVFSAFIIAALSYTLSLPLAIALAVIGIALAVSRVLLGMHFIRDVITGCVLGIASGILGILIII